MSGARPPRAKLASVLAGAVLVRALAARSAPAPAKPTRPFLGEPFTPGRGPTTAAWREEAITRANELEGLATWIIATSERPEASDPDVLIFIRQHLAAVRTTAAREDKRDNGKRLRWWTRIAAAWRGAGHERALGNLDAVEATLLRIAGDSFVCGELPSLLAHVNRFLPTADPRRVRVSELATEAVERDLTDTERGVVVAALHAANTQRRRDLLRVRSFRNVMFSASTVLLPLVAALAIFGFVRPTAIPLCFNPVEKSKVVCPTAEVPFVSPTPTPMPAPTTTAIGTPTPAPAAQGSAQELKELDDAVKAAANGGDILLIEIIGLIAAVVAGTAGLRNVRGTSTPYSLAVALALLKVPLGALSAVLGLVLMSGGFVPGLSALDTSAQILAWALVFGFSQQLLTRLVDQRANTLLENVGGRGTTGERRP